MGGGTDLLFVQGSGAVDLSHVANVQVVYLDSQGRNSLAIPNSTAGSSLVLYGGGAGNDVDASAVSGGKTIYYYAGVGVDSFLGGAENNTVYGTISQIASDSLAFGAGYNSLVFEDAGNVLLSNITGTVSAIYLAGGGWNNLTINDALVRSTLVIHPGGAGATVDARTLSANKSLYYYGGIEDDTLYLTAAGFNSDHLTLGGGHNSVVLTTAGSLSLADVSGLNYLYLGNGGPNALQLANSDIGSFLLISGGNSGNAIDASAVGAGKTIYYYAGAGVDSFIGGAENNTIYGTVTQLAGDSFTLEGGYNSPVFQNAGTIDLSKVTGTVSAIHLAGGGWNNLTERRVGPFYLGYLRRR
jgi:hypothetical protein